MFYMKDSLENTKEKDVQIIHERSIISCFMNGLRVFSDRYLQLGRFLWPTSLIMLLLPIPGYLAFLGRIDAYLAEWNRQKKNPDLGFRDLKSETIFWTSRRGYSFLFLVILGLLSFALFFLFAKYNVNLWYAALAETAILLAALPFMRPLMQMSFSSDSFSVALKSLKKGAMNYTMHFSFELVAGLFSLFVAIIGLLPFALLILVYCYSQHAMEIGDDVNMPTLFPLYLFLAYLIAVWLLQHIMLAYSLCKFLFWGNILAKEKMIDENDAELKD